LQWSGREMGDELCPGIFYHLPAFNPCQLFPPAGALADYPCPGRKNSALKIPPPAPEMSLTD